MRKKRHHPVGAVEEKYIPKTYDSESVGSGVIRETSLSLGDSDYASFGYWTREGSGGFVQSVGAFVTGREFSGLVLVTLLVVVKVTYSWKAVKLYTKKYGDIVPLLTETRMGAGGL